MGKRDSCRHSTSGSCENAVVAETSQQMERAQPSSIKKTMLTVLVKKKNTMELFWGYLFVLKLRKKL